MRAGALALVAAALLAPGLQGQDLDARGLERAIESSDAPRVSFRYRADPDVRRCGDHNGWTRSSRGNWDMDCWSGPIQAELDLRDGRITDLDVEIIRPGSSVPRDAEHLGTVAPGVAADYFLTLAESASERVAKDAIGAAAMADVETWPRMLELAEMARLGSEVRSAATFWVGQASAEQATRGLERLIEDDDDLEVRQSAIFALSQQDSESAVPTLMRIARSDMDPELRKSAFFWLGQHDDDPRVLPFFAEVLRGGR